MDNSSAPQNTSIGDTTIEYLEKLSTALEDKVACAIEEFSNILAARDTAREENLIKRTSREIATLSLHLLEKESEVLTLKAKEADYLSQIAVLEAERTHLRNTVSLLLSSTSWKLTAPLRKIVRLLKR